LKKKKQSKGSITNLQKFKTLNQRWFKATTETMEKLPESNLLERDYIYEKNGVYYRVLTLFKKSYGKWRYEQRQIKGPDLRIHVQELEVFFGAFMPTTRYHCVKYSDIGDYIGTHITSEDML